MVVRRNDARRRRIAIDPAAHSGDAAGGTSVVTPAPPKRKRTNQADVRTYTFGADRRSQRKTTDLIPKRLLSFLLVIMVLLAGIGILNFMNSRSSQWESVLGPQGLQAFAIQGQGSLASWFSSFLLIITGLASLQIYALRQHRCDDYRGAYRLWIWMAGLFLIASVGCVVNLESVMSSVATLLVPPSVSQRAWLPLAIKLTLMTLLVIRGVYEVRESRGSLALVVFVWIAYLTASVMQIPATQQTFAELDTNLVAGNCFLFGTVGLLLAHLTYARFVFLQAHGLIRIRIKSTKAKKTKTVAAKKSAGSKQKKAKTTPSKTTAAKKKTPAAKPAIKPVVKPAAKPVVKPATAQTKRKTATTAAKPAKKPAASRPAKPAPRPADAPVPVSRQEQSSQPKQPGNPTLQEMAAASRAKTNANRTANQSNDANDESEGIIKMSKAQRRKFRKAEKQRRRAA